ncbi:MAG: hypothetical protein D6775_05400 [Caldilineae bacterium]|nr:MAG: hypothetical protein D6775_05400 [Caldilineae bacterium]
MRVRTASSDDTGRFIRSSAIAGVVAVLVFTVAHQIFINNIWFSFPIMAAAGAVCGLCLGWSYRLLFERPSAKSWLSYNLFYDALFLLLAVASVLLFEPVITMEALLAGGPPPSELTVQALPLTALFTVLAAGIGGLIFGGRRWMQFGALLLTSILLMALLGMNVSIIGLVAIPREGWYVVAEFFGYILLLNAVYAATVTMLESKSFRGSKFA